MKIGDRIIGPQVPPFIIAELSGNHNGDINNVFKLIDAAKAAGADAVKLQCYTPDTMTLDCDRDEFQIQTGAWKGYTLFQLYKEAHTPYEWMGRIFLYGRSKGILIFASVFDETSIDLLEGLGAVAYKIASFELTDHPLIKAVARTNKPLIISTGMGTTREIIDAANIYYGNSESKQLALLHCVSAYPAPASDANLPALGPLASLLGGRHVVGLSDHTLGYGVAAAAVAMGASIIEKHLCLDRALGGVDSGFSLEPAEFALMVNSIHEAWQAIQNSQSKSQKDNRQFRRSIYVTAPVSSGDIFSKANVRVIRPAFGLPPSAYENVLGRRAKVDLQAGTPLLECHLCDEGEV